MTKLKAIVTKVPFGEFEIEGLMLPDGEFAIAVSQVSSLFPKLVTQNNATRTVKALAGIDSPLLKTSSELHSKKVNYINLKQFQTVIMQIAFKGDEQAQNMMMLLVSLSLEQLWSDAFGIKFEKEERQEFLKQQMIHRKYYHDRFTPWCKLDLDRDEIFDKQQREVEYGYRMNQLKLRLTLPQEHISTYSSEQLQKINDAELVYHTLRNEGISHLEALTKATKA